MTQGGESLLSWAFKFFNFAVLIAIIVKFAGKPLKNYLQNRHRAIKEKLEEANSMVQEAEKLKAEYEGRLAKLDDELAVFKKTMMDDAQREKQKILAEANEFAARIREQARITYEQELREATGKIKEEIARLTMERAEKLVKEKLTKDDHNVMVDDFIEKIRSLN
jgi:F-type H+-transporting ATPase subunit b